MNSWSIIGWVWIAEWLGLLALIAAPYAIGMH